MTAEDYNEKSMKKYGWSAWNFELPFSSTSQEVVVAVKKFQLEYGLEADGKVGPVTIRRMYAEKELRELDRSAQGFISVNGSPVSVPFKARMCGPGSEFDLTQFGDFTTRTTSPTQVVWHWDCCLSAKSCHRVLSKRGISSHGCIDNDGTFVQFLDLATCAGWHAGHRKVNRASIGIDITNAVYLKYQKWYRRNFGPRPVIEDAVTNGHKHRPFLGYYPAQVETAKSLARVLNEVLGIRLATPTEAAVLTNPENFEGHIAHYHITKKKWDVAGFPFEYLVGNENSYRSITTLQEDE
jgi:hypothetical protein